MAKATSRLPECLPLFFTLFCSHDEQKIPKISSIQKECKKEQVPGILFYFLQCKMSLYSLCVFSSDELLKFFNTVLKIAFNLKNPNHHKDNIILRSLNKEKTHSCVFVSSGL